jgi:hypothetical protein
VLLEPVQASAGYIIPGDGYLRGIRELCRRAFIGFPCTAPADWRAAGMIFLNLTFNSF